MSPSSFKPRYDSHHKRSSILTSPVFPTADGLPAPIWRRWCGRRWRTSTTLCPRKLCASDASSSIFGQFSLVFILVGSVCFFVSLFICMFVLCSDPTLDSHVLSMVIISLTDMRPLFFLAFMWKFLSPTLVRLCEKDASSPFCQFIYYT